MIGGLCIAQHWAEKCAFFCRYTSPDFLYVRSWLPCIFFAGGITMGNIGRQLAMVSLEERGWLPSNKSLNVHIISSSIYSSQLFGSRVYSEVEISNHFLLMYLVSWSYCKSEHTHALLCTLCYILSGPWAKILLCLGRDQAVPKIWPAQGTEIAATSMCTELKEIKFTWMEFNELFYHRFCRKIT